MALQVWYKGLGGGGWAAVHPKGYFVKYVHHHYIQLVLDIGIWGLIAFLVAVGVPVMQALRFRTKESRFCLPLAAVFLVHLGFDIDFAFPLAAGLFLFLIGMIQDSSKANDTKRITKVG
ncbi:hypothetical protein [Paenibacillus gansuensis]|uniref:O-antigen ligase domain-containing protein n=1 Tax=Paenibacillus gansuensis TaxID=306542 RepID=A0ABW5PJT6_9BACL